MIFFQEVVAGQYDAELFTVHGLTLESRKRREHLSTDDLQKNKAILESFTKGGNLQNLDQNGLVSLLRLFIFKLSLRFRQQFRHHRSTLDAIKNPFEDKGYT